MEAARSAAINQEIKRVLTEVLLKVADDQILMNYTLDLCSFFDYKFCGRLLMNFLMKLLPKFLMKMVSRLKVIAL